MEYWGYHLILDCKGGDLDKIRSSKNIDQCVTGDRMVWCEGTKVSATIYERLDLPVNTKVFGPAILEQPDTTIFIEPKMYGEVDKYGNLIIRWNKE